MLFPLSLWGSLPSVSASAAVETTRRFARWGSVRAAISSSPTRWVGVRSLARRAGVLGVVLPCLAAAAGEAAEPKSIDGVNFQVADGWTLERVAAAPQVQYPVCGDFAPDGRLFVAESSGSSAPVAQQREERPHRLICLEDTTGDGHFDRRTVFADDLMLPQGVLWWRDSVLVAAPPEILQFRDTDGDGTADERTVWFDGKTLTGCANDLHGPYAGRDGAVYWCKGAFAEQKYQRADGSEWITRASHILRRHPHSGAVESVMTGGMDNPVEVATTLCGERFFTCTFIQNPADGLRDALVHAVYGGIYGKSHGVLEGHVRTGPLMPVLAHLGPAAPAGLMLRQSSLTDEDLLGELLVAQFNLQKVSRHRLIPDGSAFRTEDADLLVADRPDFHPTDVLEDADGSLLVIDTGGWYTLCCPTSHIDQSRATGGIYRLRQIDRAAPADPRGDRLSWTGVSLEEVASRLADARPAVRRRACRFLVDDRGGDVIGTLAATLDSRRSSPLQRAEAIWCLIERVGLAGQERPEEIEQGLRQLIAVLDDPVPTVQLAAAQGLALYRYAPASDALRRWVREGTPRQRRAAAEALGRIGAVDAAGDLLAAAAEEDVDRPLEHALLYALYEIGDAAAAVLTMAIEEGEPRRRAAAMRVLDQLGSEALKPRHVLAALESDWLPERQLAAEILSRRGQWESLLADQLPNLLRRGLDADDAAGWQVTLQRLLGRPALVPAVGQLIAAGPAELREEILAALAAAPPATLPAPWIEPIAVRLEDESSGAEEHRRWASVLAAVQWDQPAPAPLVAALQRAMLRWSEQDDLWLMLAAAAPPRTELQDGAQPSEPIGRLTAALEPEQSPRIRQLALAALRRQTIDRSTAMRLASAVPRLGPMELRGVLELLHGEHDRQINDQLIDALATHPRIDSLPADEIEQHFADHSAEIRRRAAEVVERLSGDQRQRRASHLAQLLTDLPEGDPVRGFQLFRSSRAACSTCHAIGYHGGRIGPDLTRIHSIRTRQDLLESIVYPSSSFVRSYESVTVLTDDGRALSGIMADEDLDTLTLVMGIDQRVRIERSAIEAIQPSPVSIMPAGLDQQLSQQELADLLALLQSER